MNKCKHERATITPHEFHTCTLYIKYCPDCHDVFEDEIIDTEEFTRELERLLAELEKAKQKQGAGTP